MNEDDYNAALPTPRQCFEYFGLFLSDDLSSKRLQAFFKLALEIDNVIKCDAKPLEGHYAYSIYAETKEGKADILFHLDKPFELVREREENTRYIELFYNPINREDDLDLIKSEDIVTEMRILSTPTLARIIEEPASKEYDGDYVECAIAWIDFEMAKDPLEDPDSSSLTFSAYVESVYERDFRHRFRTSSRLFVEPIGPFRVQIQIDLAPSLTLDAAKGPVELLPYLKMDVDLGSPMVFPHLYLDILGRHGKKERAKAESYIKALVALAKGSGIIESDIEEFRLPLATFPFMKPDLSSEEGRKKFEEDLIELTSTLLESLEK